MSEKAVSRRQVLKLTAAALIGAGLADQGAGFLYEIFGMRDYPEVEVARNPHSQRTTIIVGGEGNDGIAIARAMSPYLLPIGSVLGVRYAQTNVAAKPLAAAINTALNRSGLQANRIDAYLNSAAGPIMAEPLRQLARARQLGTVVLDGSPHNAGDIRGFLGGLIQDHADVLEHSRAITLLSHIFSNSTQPPARDKAPGVPLRYAEANRRAIVNADAITLGTEAAAIRNGVPAGALYNLAQEFVYLHGQGDDPLINNARALAGWRLACGAVREITDPYRPPASHAAGDTYPLAVAQVLLGQR
jgi:hypothetical protein